MASPSNDPIKDPTEDDLNICLRVLGQLDKTTKRKKVYGTIIGEVFSAVQRVSDFPSKKEISVIKQQKRKREAKEMKDEIKKDESGLRQQRLKRKRYYSTYVANPLDFTYQSLIESATTTQEQKKDVFKDVVCYVCKKEGQISHSFYKCMCNKCGDENYQKRHSTANLEGEVAIVTGARIKIGYEIGLKLLRAGAIVIATSRFPTDLCLRYAHEPDFSSFKDKLHAAYLDLSSSESIDNFNQLIKGYNVSILINNAAQTIARSPSFYAQEINLETMRAQGLLTCPSPHLLLTHLPYFSHESSSEEIKETDEYGQPIDPNPRTSWVLNSTEISVKECQDVHFINAIAPFLLIQKLTPVMRRNDGILNHIVNVSSMEGSFSKLYKSGSHVHTNMAKASMNMITRTLADVYFHKYGILMNSVDTGWVDDMTPSTYLKTKDIPLDVVDGAARVLDVIFQYYSKGTVYSGTFMKDYHPSTW